MLMKSTEALDRNGIQALNFKCIFFLISKRIPRPKSESCSTIELSLLELL